MHEGVDDEDEVSLDLVLAPLDAVLCDPLELVVVRVPAGTGGGFWLFGSGTTA